MRTKILVVGSSVLLAFGSALAQDAPKPGPEQKTLGYFAGKWTSEGEMKPGPFGPGGKMTSVDTCEWFAGGFQLVCRGQGGGAMGPMTTLGVLAYNPADKAYTFYGIDTRRTETILGPHLRGNSEAERSHSSWVTSWTRDEYIREFGPPPPHWLPPVINHPPASAPPSPPAPPAGLTR